jgi:hypothetical protein
MRLMRRLPLPRKMMLMALLLLPPLLLMLGLSLSDGLRTLAAADRARAGATLARDLGDMAVLVQLHRTLSLQVAGTQSAEMISARDGVRRQITRALEHVETRRAEMPEALRLEDVWPTERRRWPRGVCRKSGPRCWPSMVRGPLA